ncbi:MAG: hypothetical protein U9Q77_13955 [Candidatus Marinimicrobia bacterium]|nr:hypothetical protein [Candidatus Neomarinimicrobiota bacterium]
MTDEKKFTIEEAHKAFAPGIFNRVWDLLEKEDRSTEDNEIMINAAHASLYHWRSVGEMINLQRGQWMIAKVYTTLGMKESALHHAQICLDLTNQHKVNDFDLSFAYEGFARAQALHGNLDDCAKYVDLARESVEQIKKKGDKDYFLEVLGKEPWFGFSED